MEIYATTNGWAAYMVRDLLAASGISTRVSDGTALPHATYYRVHLVNHADAERAREIVREFDETPLRETERAWNWTWRCPNCGEDIEPQFGECWNCRTPKPDRG